MRLNEERERHEAEARMRRGLTDAGLSEPFVLGRKGMHTFRELTDDHRKCREACEVFIGWKPGDGATKGLLIRGSAGIGKSHLSESVVRSLVEKGRPARYVAAADLIERLQDSFRETSKESATEILAALSTVLFLILDDLGSTKTTRFVADCLYRLLDRRARNERPTMITTNYASMSELAERLLPVDGDALDALRPTDRIEELCPRVCTLNGQSQRSLVNRPAVVAMGIANRGRTSTP